MRSKRYYQQKPVSGISNHLKVAIISTMQHLSALPEEAWPRSVWLLSAHNPGEGAIMPHQGFLSPGPNRDNTRRYHVAERLDFQTWQTEGSSACFQCRARTRVRRSYSVRSEYKRIWSEYLFASKRIKWLYSLVSHRSESANFICETNLGQKRIFA
jgi:hypothetical protein